MEERSIVSVDEASIAVKVGGKSQQADGVIAPAQSVVSAASAELLSPLVEHAADRPAQKVAVLLCYGEDAAGRDQVRAAAAATSALAACPCDAHAPRSLATIAAGCSCRTPLAATRAARWRTRGWRARARLAAYFP
eukprot:3145721-Prymnesium_polylepis.1